MTREEFDQQYTQGLNPQQREAVHTAEGPVLLLAVPGSGKTTVLVTRLGYLVCCLGVPPEEILTMTYTVAATEEMRQRFGARFGQDQAAAMEIRTINGVSAKIIEYYSRNHGKGEPFSVVENHEAARLVSRLYQELYGEFPDEGTVRDVRTEITFIKNSMLTQAELEERDCLLDRMPQLYRRYCAALRRRRWMDYDDQMTYALTILRTCPPVLDYFRRRFRYLCVDEAQDTSKVQHALIRLLTGDRGNLFLVGDEDQSIYGFRAACPEALMRFSQDYPGARVLLMEENYRSTREIAQAAQRFVSACRFRYAKSLRPTRGSGQPVQRVWTLDRRGQYDYLVEVARHPEEETAVLYRNNDSALPLIDRMEREGIPYQCQRTGDLFTSFFAHKVVSDVTDILRFAYDRHDGARFLRIYYKMGCGLPKAAALFAQSRAEETGEDLLTAALAYPDLTDFAREGVQRLQSLLPALTEDDGENALLRIWQELRYGSYVQEKKLDTGKLDILRMLARDQPSPAALLDRLDQLRTLTQNHQNDPAVPFVLSTIHASKGLEFERVYLLDVLDGILPMNPTPSLQDEEAVKEYEEERRLYYVAMTRAREALYLFECSGKESAFTAEVLAALPRPVGEEGDALDFLNRNLCGKHYRDRTRGRGRILAQCGTELLVEYDAGDRGKLTLGQMIDRRDPTVRYRPATHRERMVPRTAPAQAPTLAPGEQVIHRVFGPGAVLAVEGDIAQVDFGPERGTKRLAILSCFRSGLLRRAAE